MEFGDRCSTKLSYTPATADCIEMALGRSNHPNKRMKLRSCPVPFRCGNTPSIALHPVADAMHWVLAALTVSPSSRWTVDLLFSCDDILGEIRREFNTCVAPAVS